MALFICLVKDKNFCNYLALLEWPLEKSTKVTPLRPIHYKLPQKSLSYNSLVSNTHYLFPRYAKQYGDCQRTKLSYIH